ncbi:MAG: Omp28 family outer membrane lipoprotein [Dysgonamonadaceae bacterium]|jgi:hypothetical protein|nr:Omp28 family outer membrane lipoprotein [Dysgonamonadaceae bacterium]
MKKNWILLFITTLLFVGCDVIPENDRVIEMEKTIPLKRILLLDFTDQGCINCLRATDEIQSLLNIYKDTLIAVSIHAAPRAFSLVTEDGNRYDEYFKVSGHPTGIIDGVFSSSNPQLWNGYIMERAIIPPILSLELSVSYEEETRKLNTVSRIKGLAKHSGLRLLLWVVESKIIDRQLMLDGQYKLDYEHNHVFRAAINGTWGSDAFSMDEQEEKTMENSYTLNEKWKTENISIVSFIYDAHSNEVLDVAETTITDNESEKPE